MKKQMFLAIIYMSLGSQCYSRYNTDNNNLITNSLKVNDGSVFVAKFNNATLIEPNNKKEHVLTSEDQYRFGYHYLHTEPNYKSAVTYLSLAVERGYKLARESLAWAQYRLGYFYLHRKHNIKEAVTHLSSAVENGYKPAIKSLARAQYRLGYHYLHKEHNYAKAVTYLSLAVEKGHKPARESLTRAQYRLGCFYLDTELNYEKAVTYLSLAAENGHKPAREDLSVADKKRDMEYEAAPRDFIDFINNDELRELLESNPRPQSVFCFPNSSWLNLVA